MIRNNGRSKSESLSIKNDDNNNMTPKIKEKRRVTLYNEVSNV